MQRERRTHTDAHTHRRTHTHQPPPPTGLYGTWRSTYRIRASKSHKPGCSSILPMPWISTSKILVSHCKKVIKKKQTLLQYITEATGLHIEDPGVYLTAKNKLRGVLRSHCSSLARARALSLSRSLALARGLSLLACDLTLWEHEISLSHSLCIHTQTHRGAAQGLRSHSSSCLRCKQVPDD